MPRTKKTRLIRHQPPVAVFKPAGVPARVLGRSVLSLDGYEALRLADYEGLDQEAVAARLGVSRPTVSRILAEARGAVARALVEGSALAIEGGAVFNGLNPPPADQTGQPDIKYHNRGKIRGDAAAV